MDSFNIEAMVPFHKVLDENPKTEVPAELEASSKKKRWEEPLTEELFEDQSNAEKRRSIFDIELHLETPLPSHKWQQYLSIQSGKIHMCNTKIYSKTPDSKRSPELEPELPSHGQMSIDLELNLTCESLRKKENSYDINEKKNYGSTGRSTSAERDLLIESSKYEKESCGLTRSPSLFSSAEDNREMIATVCMQCHMLVMLFKSSPSCPNCKFMHPPDHNPSKFLKRRRCGLLC